MLEIMEGRQPAEGLELEKPSGLLGNNVFPESGT